MTTNDRTAIFFWLNNPLHKYAMLSFPTHRLRFMWTLSFNYCESHFGKCGGGVSFW